MKMHDIKDKIWLTFYRGRVRLGYDPRRAKNGKRRLYKRIGFRKVILNPEKSNAILREALTKDRFFVARIGYTEGRTFGFFRQYQLGMDSVFPDELREHAKNSSGIFSTDDEGLSTFCKVFAENMGEVTHLCMFSTEFEPLLVRNYGRKAKLISSGGLEHFRYVPSWMESLRGKKVLVVSMFAETIEKQFKKASSLFPTNPSANPLFASLETVKAEVTYGGETPKYKNWKGTLDHMYEECMAHDFDVAILSCGGYGLPLGGMLFRAGKNVIHSGGITQLYFGIYGNRYENENYNWLFNENWVRPAENERTVSYKSIENGAYW